jgi:hypothetical protein
MTSSSMTAARSQYLLDLLAQVPDPRKRRGRRHQLASLLAVGIAAVIAGSRSFAVAVTFRSPDGRDVGGAVDRFVDRAAGGCWCDECHG